MTTKLTREQAEAVLRQVETYYSPFIDPGYGPKLVENWEKTFTSPEPTTPWAIVWYEAPLELEWARYTADQDNQVIDHTNVYVEATTFQVLSLWPV